MTHRLYAGTRLLGELTVTHDDFPRTYATFAPAPDFEAVRSLFEQQAARVPASGAAIDALDLRIVWSGQDVGEPLSRIHIEGDRAMWREGFLRRLRIQSHDAFWKILGPELGPDTCWAEDCTRLAIAQSAFCQRHHFRMIMHEDYAGTLDM